MYSFVFVTLLRLSPENKAGVFFNTSEAHVMELIYIQSKFTQVTWRLFITGLDDTPEMLEPRSLPREELELSSRSRCLRPA